MPIDSFDGLRRFLEAERKRTGRDRLGNKALGALAHMLDHPGTAAVASISELAASSDVDPSTLTRLGKRLGYRGFTGLQDVFRHYVAQTQPFYSARVHDRVQLARTDPQPEAMRSHAQSECRKVLATAQQIQPETIAAAAELLASARKVSVLGLRATYSLAFFLGTYLAAIRANVQTLGGAGHTLTSDLVALEAPDVLVAISFRPYTRHVITAVEIARTAGVKVLAITDVGSPLEVGPAEGVTICVDQPFYFDSSTAHFFVIQTILLAAAQRIGPAAVAVTRKRERVHKALSIEVQ